MPLIEAEPNYTGEVAGRWVDADGSGKIVCPSTSISLIIFQPIRRLLVLWALSVIA